MLFIFDWDGTLCDSLAKIVSCLQLAASQVGEGPLAAEDARQIIGLALPVAVARLFPDASHQQRDAIAENYRQAFAKSNTPAPLFSGVKETLDELRRRGHRLAVATGKARPGLDRSLAGVGLSDYFCATRCADETASKPDPKMLLELLAELDHGAEQAVMVGDTTFDLQMANNASMQSIGVTFGSHSSAQLQGHSPKRLVNAIPELLAWEMSLKSKLK